MNRREFEVWLGAVVAGIVSGAAAVGQEKPVAEVKGPKHVCKGLNECRGQGECKHGCGNNGCHGKNDCKGRGGCASKAATHACKGKNDCKALGGCATGDNRCAGRNSCKGKGGCEVPLKIEHTTARQQAGHRSKRTR